MLRLRFARHGLAALESLTPQVMHGVNLSSVFSLLFLGLLWVPGSNNDGLRVGSV